MVPRTDERYKRAIHIDHIDGSVWFIQGAFLLQYGPVTATWVLCLTRDHGVRVYMEDELIGYAQFEPLDEIEEL